MTKAHTPPPDNPCCDTLESLMEDQEAQEWASLFHALGDRTRVRILAILCHYPGQVCVCHLVDALPLEQPTISHHLMVLRNAGLVSYEKRGVWAYYYPRWDTLRKFRKFVDSTLAQEAKA